MQSSSLFFAPSVSHLSLLQDHEALLHHDATTLKDWLQTDRRIYAQAGKQSLSITLLAALRALVAGLRWRSCHLVGSRVVQLEAPEIPAEDFDFSIQLEGYEGNSVDKQICINAASYLRKVGGASNIHKFLYSRSIQDIAISGCFVCLGHSRRSNSTKVDVMVTYWKKHPGLFRCGSGVVDLTDWLRQGPCSSIRCQLSCYGARVATWRRDIKERELIEPDIANKRHGMLRLPKWICHKGFHRHPGQEPAFWLRLLCDFPEFQAHGLTHRLEQQIEHHLSLDSTHRSAQLICWLFLLDDAPKILEAHHRKNLHQILSRRLRECWDPTSLSKALQCRKLAKVVQAKVTLLKVRICLKDPGMVLDAPLRLSTDSDSRKWRAPMSLGSDCWLPSPFAEPPDITFMRLLQRVRRLANTKQDPSFSRQLLPRPLIRNMWEFVRASHADLDLPRFCRFLMLWDPELAESFKLPAEYNKWHQPHEQIANRATLWLADRCIKLTRNDLLKLSDPFPHAINTADFLERVRSWQDPFWDLLTLRLAFLAHRKNPDPQTTADLLSAWLRVLDGPASSKDKEYLLKQLTSHGTNPISAVLNAIDSEDSKKDFSRKSAVIDCLLEKGATECIAAVLKHWPNQPCGHVVLALALQPATLDLALDLLSLNPSFELIEKVIDLVHQRVSSDQKQLLAHLLDSIQGSLTSRLIALTRLDPRWAALRLHREPVVLPLDTLAAILPQSTQPSIWKAKQLLSASPPLGPLAQEQVHFIYRLIISLAQTNPITANQLHAFIGISSETTEELEATNRKALFALAKGHASLGPVDALEYYRKAQQGCPASQAQLKRSALNAIIEVADPQSAAPLLLLLLAEPQYDPQTVLTLCKLTLKGQDETRFEIIQSISANESMPADIREQLATAIVTEYAQAGNPSAAHNQLRRIVNNLSTKEQSKLVLEVIHAYTRESNEQAMHQAQELTHRLKNDPTAWTIAQLTITHEYQRSSSFKKLYAHWKRISDNLVDNQELKDVYLHFYQAQFKATGLTPLLWNHCIMTTLFTNTISSLPGLHFWLAENRSHIAALFSQILAEAENYVQLMSNQPDQQTEFLGNLRDTVQHGLASDLLSKPQERRNLYHLAMNLARWQIDNSQRFWSDLLMEKAFVDPVFLTDQPGQESLTQLFGAHQQGLLLRAKTFSKEPISDKLYAHFLIRAATSLTHLAPRGKLDEHCPALLCTILNDFFSEIAREPKSPVAQAVATIYGFKVLAWIEGRSALKNDRHNLRARWTTIIIQRLLASSNPLHLFMANDIALTANQTFRGKKHAQILLRSGLSALRDRLGPLLHRRRSGLPATEYTLISPQGQTIRRKPLESALIWELAPRLDPSVSTGIELLAQVSARPEEKKSKSQVSTTKSKKISQGRSRRRRRRRHN